MVATSGVASAFDLKVATWNLGWHVSKAEAADWIARCDAPFEEGPDGIWRPASTGTPGWALKWGRDARIEWAISARPPCDVYKDGSFDTVAVTTAAYDKRAVQIASIIKDGIDPDVIAFQEVSGAGAIREVLPGDDGDWNVCSFSGYKVQRLGFAWRKSLGDAVETCEPDDALSLPEVPDKDRVRPGLSLGLKVDGKLVRFLSVHLKSSCVSPLGAEGPDGRGALAGQDPACQVLQQQVAPLEAWIERKAAGAAAIVVLGDFNRNLPHEIAAGDQVRSDGSDPASPHPSGVKVASRIGEVDDGEPAAADLTLLEAHCPVTPDAEAACARLKTAKSRDDEAILRRWENLGCRNPIGLDHILVGSGVLSDGANKVPLGKRGRSLPADQNHLDPLLAVSDHCPLRAVVRF
ncbi:endonuclease/exonuclease/phosphatase family protein [Oharaeibacter diazotrophicus]|uniref:endonuclease/exonuclease/phosphatase family protein n=1 Tax=Oharaeibacter diazotrophicus TaxID=1920512 RepID=UPI001A992862|nr:endonuclease/exonuclease/phosphatase family protein [Oharaeibacter diazotrophicus]